LEDIGRGRGDGAEAEGGLGGPVAGGGPGPVLNVDAQAIVDTLVAMGITLPMAQMAVRETGASTAEEAIAWVFENEASASLALAEQDERLFQDFKMVFVVNTSLPMTPGKMAAQVGHAAIGIYQDLISKQDTYGGPLLQWSENGCRKIVLQCKDEAHMNELAAEAEKLGLPTNLIRDAGHTQIPSGSQTVMAVFGVISEVDKVTGQLKLLP